MKVLCLSIACCGLMLISARTHAQPYRIVIDVPTQMGLYSKRKVYDCASPDALLEMVARVRKFGYYCRVQIRDPAALLAIPAATFENLQAMGVLADSLSTFEGGRLGPRIGLGNEPDSGSYAHSLMPIFLGYMNGAIDRLSFAVVIEGMRAIHRALRVATHRNGAAWSTSRERWTPEVTTEWTLSMPPDGRRPLWVSSIVPYASSRAPRAEPHPSLAFSHYGTTASVLAIPKME